MHSDICQYTTKRCSCCKLLCSKSFSFLSVNGRLSSVINLSSLDWNTTDTFYVWHNFLVIIVACSNAVYYINSFQKIWPLTAMNTHTHTIENSQSIKFSGQDYKNLSLLWGEIEKSVPRNTVWRLVMPDCDREERTFLSTPYTHDRFFF